MAYVAGNVLFRTNTVILPTNEKLLWGLFGFFFFFLVSTFPFPISLKHQVVSLIHIVQYRCKCTNCHYRFLVGSQPTTLAYSLTSVICHCSFENLFLKSGILGWKENGKDVDRCGHVNLFIHNPFVLSLSIMK